MLRPPVGVHMLVSLRIQVSQRCTLLNLPDYMDVQRHACVLWSLRPFPCTYHKWLHACSRTGNSPHLLQVKVTSNLLRGSSSWTL